MSIKVYFVYDGVVAPGDDAREPYKAKITLPEKWLAGPCEKLLSFFVGTYNKKFGPEKAIDEAKLELQVGAVTLPLHGTVSSYVQEHNDILIVPKAAAAVVEKPPEGSVVCTNYGCGKHYMDTEEGNPDDACHHHAGAPVFHDTAKYWSCCPQKKALDWDEFEAIPKCCVGKHSTKNKQINFNTQESQVMTNTALTEEQKAGLAAGSPAAAAPAAGGADGPRHNGPREFEGAKQNDTPGKIVDGKANCRNYGCQVNFVVAENTDTACTHHSGAPVFWDTYKYWACCPDKKVYEFDDFVKIPGCTTGPHKV